MIRFIWLPLRKGVGFRNRNQSTLLQAWRKSPGRLALLGMPKSPKAQPPAQPVRVRRGYFECRFGQLHLHNTMPPGGGFEEGTPVLCIQDLAGTGRNFAPFMALAGQDRSRTRRIFRASASRTRRPRTIRRWPTMPRARGLPRRDAAAQARHLANRAGAFVGNGTCHAAPRAGRPEWSWCRCPGPLPGSAACSFCRSPAPGRASASFGGPCRLSGARTTGAPHPETARGTARATSSGRQPVRIREVLPAARVIDLEAPGCGTVGGSSPARLLEAVRDFLRGLSRIFGIPFTYLQGVAGAGGIAGLHFFAVDEGSRRPR